MSRALCLFIALPTIHHYHCHHCYNKLRQRFWMAAHTQPRRSHGNVGGPETGDWNEFMPRSIKALPVQKASASATRPPASHRQGSPETGDHAATALSRRSHSGFMDPHHQALGHGVCGPKLTPLHCYTTQIDTAPSPVQPAPSQDRARSHNSQHAQSRRLHCQRGMSPTFFPGMRSPCHSQMDRLHHMHRMEVNT